MGRGNAANCKKMCGASFVNSTSRLHLIYTLNRGRTSPRSGNRAVLWPSPAWEPPPGRDLLLPRPAGTGYTGEATLVGRIGKPSSGARGRGRSGNPSDDTDGGAAVPARLW